MTDTREPGLDPFEPFDREIREVARAARSEVEHDVTETEAALAAVVSGARLTRLQPVAPAGRRRTTACVAAVAATAVIIGGGGVVLLTGGDDRVGIRGESTPTIAPEPDPTSPDPTVPSLDPTVPAPDPTVPSPDPTVPNGVESTVAETSVSYTVPPAELVLDPVSTIPGEVGPDTQVALGDVGLIWTAGDGYVNVIRDDGSQAAVPLGVDVGDLGNVRYGPGDVMYATRAGAEPNTLEFVAVPLSGERAGQVIATSEPLGLVQYIELPALAFTHGRTGLVDRVRDIGAVVMPYVDVAGNPTTAVAALDDTVPHIDTPDSPSDPNQVLDWPAASGSIDLTVEREPGWTWPLTGADQPLVALGGLIYPTTLGAPAQPGDGAATTMPTVMHAVADPLAIDWYSIPDGWQLADSGPWGTMFTTSDGESLTLALPFGGEFGARPGSPGLDGLTWESSGIPRRCDTDQFCSSVRYGPDGTPVSYDPTTRTYSRHVRTFLHQTEARPAGDTTPVELTLPDGFGIDAEGTDRHWTVAVGPDDVLYVADVSSSGILEAFDLVALSFAAGDAGREIERWPDLLTIGDRDVVAMPDGLVTTGWYGDGPRPSPDSELLVRWVDRLPDDGFEPTDVFNDPIPEIRIDASAATVTVDDRTWSLTVLPVQIDPVGMPPIRATFDGGFIAVYTNSASAVRTVVNRGYVDGTVEQWALPESMAGHGSPMPEPTGAVLFANGDSFARVWPFDQPDPDWGGQLDVDVETGAADPVGLEQYLLDNNPDWATDPRALVNAIAGPLGPAATRSIERVSGSTQQVRYVVTTERLLDDSVYGTRLEIVVVPAGDDAYGVDGVSWSQTCQPGRGHTDYRPAPCT